MLRRRRDGQDELPGRGTSLIERFLPSPPTGPPPQPQPAERPLAPRASLVDRAVGLARDLAAQHRLDEACHVLEDALQHRTGDLRLLNNLGLLRYQVGRYEEAEACFVAALERYYREGLPVDDRCAVIRDNLSKLRAVVGSGMSQVLRDDFMERIRHRLGAEERILHCICGIVRLPVEVRPGPGHGFVDQVETLDCSAVMAATNRRIIYEGQAALAHDRHGGTHPLSAVADGKASHRTRFHDDLEVDDVADVQIATDGPRTRLTVTLDDGRTQSLATAAREDVRKMAAVLLDLLERRIRTGRLLPGKGRPELAERLKERLRELEDAAGDAGTSRPQ